jgi:ABC-type glycerol-3-phosphate transport system substrate-binding protein
VKRISEMRITRRQITRTAAGAGAVSLLAACGAPGAAGGPSATLTKAPISLRWSTWGDTTSPMVQAADKGLAIFRAKFPNITVTAEPQVNTPNGPTWTEKHQTEWLAGTGPDMTGQCCANLLDWGRQGLLLNLDANIKRDAKAVPVTDYVPTYLAAYSTPERGHFALPMYMGVIGIYYSKALFQRKGVPLPDNNWDWDKFEDAMRRLTTVSDDVANRTFGFHANINFAQHGIFIRQNGGNQVDPKDNRRALFGAPEAIKALQWLHDRTWKDKSLALDADITGATGMGFKQPYNAIAAGKLGMRIEGSQSLAALSIAEPASAKDWDVIQMPKGPVQRDTGHTFDGWAVWAGGKNIDATWELDKFLQSDEWVEIAATVVGLQPARKSWQDKYVALLKKQYPALADKNLAAFTEPIRADWARPNQYYLKNSDAQKIWSTAAAATFGTNKEALADTMRKAADDINKLHGI